MEPADIWISGRTKISPLTADALDDDAQAELSKINALAAPAQGALLTLLRHKSLFRRMMPFGAKLAYGAIPEDLRELAILRTAWRCQCAYEWGQHVRISRSLGMRDDHISAIPQGSKAECWSDVEATVLAAVDECIDHAGISDKTWSSLEAEFDHLQLIELPLLVGYYQAQAYLFNSIGLVGEPGADALPVVVGDATVGGQQNGAL